jgi:hypothetical protein
VEAFPLRSGRRQGHPCYLLLFNTLLEILAHAIRPEKEIKDIQLCKEKTKLSQHIDDMITFTENLKKKKKNHLLELISKYSKLQGITIHYLLIHL